MSIDFDIFDGKSFKDLCKDIVDRSVSKKDQLDILISDIRSLIKTPNDVQVFMPRIKELLEVGIKNDEQLVKLSAVLQRIQSSQIESSGGESDGLTEEEKNQLLQIKLKELESLKDIKKEISDSIP